MAPKCQTLARETHGAYFLQAASLSTPWHLSYRCIVQRERNLSRNNNCLAVVRNGDKDIVLQRLEENGLKLNPKMCSFCQDKVRYVRHIVPSQGIESGPEKCAKGRDWPTPATPEDVGRCLGFAGYYRRCVKGFPKIAKPLVDLTPVSQKQKMGRKTSDKSQQAKWQWGQEEEAAFQTLKDFSPPILGSPDYKLPFQLHVDASAPGLGAVLYQEQLAALASYNFDITYSHVTRLIIKAEQLARSCMCVSAEVQWYLRPIS
ncbi:hypothetical protein C0Q70_17029 [Pomacea canaliculata]|uniref:Reverse transcriptase/retrotransposon-derived protein RNase H-like domain-containing protein n=1 Tax=Pomacea canaliculata TaxID=400727 RepID=A0A2T7NRG9_POMCA|nr:hypothetical protein C0Q70_17029 [Pomacea canaliculata]